MTNGWRSQLTVNCRLPVRDVDDDDDDNDDDGDASD